MMDHSLLPKWLELATQAAHQGGKILKQFWGNLHEVREKGFPGDLITELE
jgi:myo-inositol-1(or 4)-monophosphatase